MLLKKKIHELLKETYGISFDVIERYDNNVPSIVVIPTKADNHLFSLAIGFQNNIRMNVSFEPQQYAVQMVQEMGKSSIEKKTLFCEYANQLVTNGAKLSLRINDTPADIAEYEKWPSVWNKISFRVSVVPIAFDEHDCPDYYVSLTKWLPLIMGLSLALLTVEKLDPTSDSHEGESEGKRFEVTTTRYERSLINRTLCLAVHGYTCKACGFNFEEKYGELGREYIQVHHTTPVSQMGEGFVVNPAKDLVPVCPNCHAMLHRKNPPLTVQELQDIIG